MLQRPHFFPNDKPSSVAQTAHCVRIIQQVGRPDSVVASSFASRAELAYSHTLGYSGDDAAARRQMEGLKPEAAKSLAEKEKEFQKRLAKAKTHLPLAAILKGRRAAPPKEEPKK